MTLYTYASANPAITVIIMIAIVAMIIDLVSIFDFVPDVSPWAASSAPSPKLFGCVHLSISGTRRFENIIAYDTPSAEPPYILKQNVSIPSITPNTTLPAGVIGDVT